MIETLKTIVEHVAMLCAFAMGAIAVVCLCAIICANMRRSTRRWREKMSASCRMKAELIVAAILLSPFVVVCVLHGGSKVGIRWDTGLSDNGSSVTNNTVSIAWTYSGIPSKSIVYIDYREAGSTNEWMNLAEAIASVREWTGTLEDATNYEYWVYSTYIPPVPVHTNGVWVGQTYETKARVGAKAFLILNGKVQEHGRTIAPPAAKRKEDGNE